MALERTVSSYIDHGTITCRLFLVNCPLVRIRGAWCMDFNMLAYETWLDKYVEVNTKRRPSDIVIVDCKAGAGFELVTIMKT